MRASTSRKAFSICLAASLLAFGCSHSTDSSSGSTGGSGSTPGSNVQAIQVNLGPDSQLPYVDGAFTSVTVCAPGSSTNCQTISDVLVDTGSPGLRILSSALTVPLTQQVDSNSNPIAECGVFEDGFTWGPVQAADVKIAGEEASSLPIQVIGSASFPTIPAACANQGDAEDTLAGLGANGLLGIGQTVQDCGTACVNSGQGIYYSCPSSGCVDTTEALLKQVQNPVASFATDNNGVILELPSVAVSSPQATLSGSLIFGIGTQSNNSLGSATVFGTDAYGDMSTTYQSVPYTSFFDSGSNGIYFLDSGTSGIATCTDPDFWYCPSSTQTISVQNSAYAGTNGASAATSFSVGNADTLISSGGAALNGIAGPFPGSFDFGLPFFFGRNVYVAIEGRSTPGGTGPYTAY